MQRIGRKPQITTHAVSKIRSVLRKTRSEVASYRAAAQADTSFVALSALRVTVIIRVLKQRTNYYRLPLTLHVTAESSNILGM